MQLADKQQLVKIVREKVARDASTHFQKTDPYTVNLQTVVKWVVNRTIDIVAEAATADEYHQTKGVEL